MEASRIYCTYRPNIFTIFFWVKFLLLSKVKFCKASIVYLCHKLILFICFAQCVELGKNRFFYAESDLRYRIWTAICSTNSDIQRPSVSALRSVYSVLREWRPWVVPLSFLPVWPRMFMGGLWLGDIYAEGACRQLQTWLHPRISCPRECTVVHIVKHSHQKTSEKDVRICSHF